MRVLVAGGAGYIGSVVAEELIAGGHEVVVYDSLYKGHRGAVPAGAEFVEADLSDAETLRRTFRARAVEAVIHMAADSLVGESVAEPAKYYRNNVVAGLVLLEAMRDEGVARIVFSSTAAVYGEPEKHPIEETDPTRPTNPYGETKLAFERALRWHEAAYGIRYATLRYFNAAGATEQRGEVHEPETHLIPLVLQVAAGRRERVEVYGDDYPTRDGTCVRDYIHVVDLARARPRARHPWRAQRHIQPRLRRRRLHRARSLERRARCDRPRDTGAHHAAPLRRPGRARRQLREDRERAGLVAAAPGLKSDRPLGLGLDAVAPARV